MVRNLVFFMPRRNMIVSQIVIIITCTVIIIGICVCWSRRTRFNTATQYIVLQEFIGGLGNQLFQVAALLSLARKNGIECALPKQDISPGFVNSPTYLDDLFKSFHVIDVYAHWPKFVHASQFDYQDQQDFVNKNKNNAKILVISGMFMNLRFCVDDIDVLREMLFPEYRKDAPSHKVLLGIRGFTEEEHPEWRLPTEFYKSAMAELSTEDSEYEFLVLTDDEAYALDLLTQLNISRYEVIVGNRGWDSIKLQYEKAMHCDHFILGNSTFHIWPALFAKALDHQTKCIVYPDISTMTSIEMEVYPNARFTRLAISD